jgi:hypothetical protein
MATYTELFDEFKSKLLLKRIVVAIIVAADTVLNESPATANHANRLIWAKDAFTDPENYAKRFLAAILGANNGATVAQIQGSSDTQIQNNVDAAIDVFAGSQ